MLILEMSIKDDQNICVQVHMISYKGVSDTISRHVKKLYPSVYD